MLASSTTLASLTAALRCRARRASRASRCSAQQLAHAVRSSQHRVAASSSPLRTSLAHAAPRSPPGRLQATPRHVIAAADAAVPETGEYPDPAFVAAVRAALPAHGVCGAEAARTLYADGHAFLDVRSALELESEGKLLPQQPGVFHVPFVSFTKRFDAASGRKLIVKEPNAGFLAAAAKALPDKTRGVVVVCSGVDDKGVLRAAAAADALRAAGHTRVVVLSRGYADWCLRFTNKLERRVLGFLIASGGTSIEQRGGGGSKASGVGGKGLDAMVRDAQAAYLPGGVYA